MFELTTIPGGLDAVLAAVAQYSADCYLNSDDLLGCTLDGATAATRGTGLFAIMFVGTMLASNWLAGNQSLATPAVLLILLAGVVMSYLPGQFRGLALTMIVIGVAGSIWVIGKRYILNPGTSP